jgi:hypothetical protein
VIARIPLPIQTVYADLVDRCSIATFEADFPVAGSFKKVPVKGRDYWYFQPSAADDTGKRQQKYVGPDSEDIRARIEQHGKVKDAYRERREMVRALRRSGLPAPLDTTGELIELLAKAGIFRLRACLVGTAAFQAYSGLLGIKLPGSSMQTSDLDLAQFHSVSLAIGQDEQTAPVIEILRKADPSFRSVPHEIDSRMHKAYVNDRTYRVEVLTPNRGPDRGRPVELPALQAHGQPLRFLDFLIYDAIPAVILRGGGTLVNVPSPERYALHKLIVSQRRRREGAAKIDKDLMQAEILLDVLADSRKADLRDAWHELVARGPKWRQHVVDGIAAIDSAVWGKVAAIVKEEF